MDLRRRLHSIARVFRRDRVFPSWGALHLDNPLRRLVLSPETLAQRLALEPGARVLEVGCGPGYFSVAVAESVPRGLLCLLDLQEGMLTRARRKLSAKGVANAVMTSGDACRLPLKGACFDAVFLVAVLGETPDPAACLGEAFRCLRPGGLLSDTESPGDPDLIPLDDLRALAEGQGFRHVESFGRGRNFTVHFRRPGPDAPGTMQERSVRGDGQDAPHG